MSVTVTVQCLGQLRDSVSATPITLTCNADAGALLDALAAQFEAIIALGGAVVLATDDRYLQRSDALVDGMTLVLVPPISGG
jgi:molybdopterin converting factor small subunit